MVWDTGTFEFAIDDLRPIDDIALYPSDVLPDADINTQMVLLEAARIFDERNRDDTQPGAEARHAAAAAAGDGYEDGDSTHPTLLEARPAASTALAVADSDLDLGEPKHAAELLLLHVVSADAEFAEGLAEALLHEVAGVELVPLGQAGIVSRGEPQPIARVDLRRGNVTLDEAAALRRARPRASFIALVGAGTAPHRGSGTGTAAAP